VLKSLQPIKPAPPKALPLGFETRETIMAPEVLEVKKYETVQKIIKNKKTDMDIEFSKLIDTTPSEPDTTLNKNWRQMTT